MALNCPNCGAAIPTENINIQEMVALCDQCGNVFNFKGQVQARKAKPRTVPRPKKLRLQEQDDRLEISHRRVYSPSDQAGCVGAGSIFAGLPTLIYFVGLLDSGLSTALLIIIGVIIAALWGVLIWLLLMTTRIIADEETLSVRSRQFSFYRNNVLNWQEIVRVLCEETGESQQSSSPDKYYHLSVEMTDGRQIPIQRALPENYAFYITQVLNDRLPTERVTDQIVPGDAFFEETPAEDVALADEEHHDRHTDG